MDRLRVLLPAVAGVLIIMAGTVLPAEGALPLKRKRCGATVTSSFRLKNNLTRTGDGLKVGKNRITIHLNGKTIRGDGDADDFGIDNSAGFGKVVIKNGTLRRFDDGVKIGASFSNTVRNVTVRNSSFDGIDVDGGRGHQIIDNDTSASGENGIEFKGRNSTLRGNVATANAVDGLFVGAVEDVDVVGNRADHNLDVGIRVEGNDSTVRDNTACGNDDAQVVVVGAGNVVEDNVTQDLCP